MDGWGLRLAPRPWERGRLPRFDDHARDMAFDQIAVRGSRRGLPVTYCRKISESNAHALEWESASPVSAFLKHLQRNSLCLSRRRNNQPGAVRYNEKHQKFRLRRLARVRGDPVPLMGRFRPELALGVGFRRFIAQCGRYGTLQNIRIDESGMFMRGRRAT
jgi:hypothetical protein